MGKERIRVDKYKSLKKKKRKGFHGTRYADMQANSNNETSEQSTSSEIPPGAGGEDELPADIESKNKVIEKIVPLDSNLEIHFDGVQTRKRRRANRTRIKKKESNKDCQKRNCRQGGLK